MPGIGEPPLYMICSSISPVEEFLLTNVSIISRSFEASCGNCIFSWLAECISRSICFSNRNTMPLFKVLQDVNIRYPRKVPNISCDTLMLSSLVGTNSPLE